MGDIDVSGMAGVEPIVFFRVLLLISLLGVTAFLAVAPGSLSPLVPLVTDWVPGFDHRYAVILSHLFGFAALVVIVTWLFGRLLPAALAVLAFSGVLEAVQTQIAWREGSWLDLGLNAAAVVLGVLLAYTFRRMGAVARMRKRRAAVGRT